MPNWVFNTVYANDAKVMEWLRSNLVADGAATFTKLVPMPSEIRDTKCPMDVLPDDLFKAEYVDNSKARSLCTNHRRLDEEGLYECVPPYPYSSDGISRITAMSASAAKRFVEKYNAVDWYGWANRNWGCKWDCADTEIDEHTIRFNTAWTQPDMFMCVLAEKLCADLGPEAAIAWDFEGDTGWGGETVLRNGRVRYVKTWDEPEDDDE